LTAPAFAGDEQRTLQDWLADEYEIDLSGFLEARNGWRLDTDLDQKDASLAETRLQLDLGTYLGWGSMKLKGDLVGDAVEEEMRGELREGNLLFSPRDNLDIKAGRQTLTWGTGDLLFVNDIFPKDWESFFIGRDAEYLKVPSDAVKASLFFQAVNLDLVWMAPPNNSTFIDGSRLSYWNGFLGRQAGREAILVADERNRFFADSELALRLFKNINGTEYALYGSYGFWSTPEGSDPISGRLVYPQLAVYGASIRNPVAGGIGNLEVGYYDSLDDQSGADPFLRNSEWRFLGGFERELARDFTGGLQYYLEWKQDYGQYERNLPVGMPKEDEFRHLMTLRLTRLAFNQNLALSFFAYYSPTDKDAYLRPNIHYKLTDHWSVEAGGNLFFGSRPHTFFGQFEDNTNLYAGVRRSF
jgi:hypothetical protein